MRLLAGNPIAVWKGREPNRQPVVLQEAMLREIVLTSTVTCSALAADRLTVKTACEASTSSSQRSFRRGTPGPSKVVAADVVAHTLSLSQRTWQLQLYVIASSKMVLSAPCDGRCVGRSVDVNNCGRFKHPSECRSVFYHGRHRRRSRIVRRCFF